MSLRISSLIPSCFPRIDKTGFESGILKTFYSFSMPLLNRSLIRFWYPGSAYCGDFEVCFLFDRLSAAVCWSNILLRTVATKWTACFTARDSSWYLSTCTPSKCKCIDTTSLRTPCVCPAAAVATKWLLIEPKEFEWYLSTCRPSTSPDESLTTTVAEYCATFHLHCRYCGVSLCLI